MFFGSEIIISSIGWHQGCPLAPLLFSLGLKPVTDKIEEEVEDLDLHVWLLDDGHCGGDLDQLQRVSKNLGAGRPYTQPVYVHQADFTGPKVKGMGPRARGG